MLSAEDMPETQVDRGPPGEISSSKGRRQRLSMWGGQSEPWDPSSAGQLDSSWGHRDSCHQSLSEQRTLRPHQAILRKNQKDAKWFILPIEAKSFIVFREETRANHNKMSLFPHQINKDSKA